MTELSPAAQAVWITAWEECPVECGDIPGTRRKQIAAALCAAADQVAPVDPYPNDGGWTKPRGESVEIREKLLAIAAELEGFQ